MQPGVVRKWKNKKITIKVTLHITLFLKSCIDFVSKEAFLCFNDQDSRGVPHHRCHQRWDVWVHGRIRYDLWRIQLEIEFPLVSCSPERDGSTKGGQNPSCQVPPLKKTPKTLPNLKINLDIYLWEIGVWLIFHNMCVRHLSTIFICRCKVIIFPLCIPLKYAASKMASWLVCWCSVEV